MPNTTATAIFRTDLASDTKSAPEWVELFPAGPEINARDGRAWTADPKAVVAAFQANNAPLPIDYEHAQDHLAPQGKEAPAAGWITQLEDRTGAVWGRVEWTDRAAKMIADREYRFLSPAFNYDRSMKITRLLGAGLVNRPALEMTALSREEASTTEKETSMKAIAKALGLAEDANEATILAAITRRDAERTSVCQALKLDPAQTDAAATLAAIRKLAEDTATALAAANANASTAEVTALRQQLDDTGKALAALQKKDSDREIDAALDKAAADGKITPASRETYRAMCAAEGGLDRFKALVATLPVICEPSQLDTRTATTREEDELDPVALAARAQKYQADQAAVGRTVTISEAVAIVKEQK